MRLRRVLGGLTAAAGLVVTSAVVAPVLSNAATAPTSADATAVTLTVADVTPNTPPIIGPDDKPKTVVFTLEVTNDSAQTQRDIAITATRSDPIVTQAQLNSEIKSPTPPSDELRADITPVKPRTTATPKPGEPVDAVMVASLDPGATSTVEFRTTIGRPEQDRGICQCRNLIYPIYFTASRTTDGSTSELAHAQTYLPSFVADASGGGSSGPARMQVAWLWPLLDAPHRTRPYDLFRDDELATEIGPDGRLSKLLDVLQGVADKDVPITVVTDPDLIDSLAVMSTGYRIVTTGGRSVKGSQENQALAAAWLTRLRTILDDHKDQVELAFTAFADPAVQALTNAGLTWATNADSAAQKRITEALGTTAPADITWPDRERLNADALTQLARTGTSTVVLRDRSLTNGTPTVAGHSGNSDDAKTVYRVPADALAPLQTGSGSVTAAVTSTPIEQLVARIVTADAQTGLPLLPQLVAQLAIRVETSFDTSHFTLLTPPRDLTVTDPQVAVRTILATSSTAWSEPVGLRTALASGASAVDHGALLPYTGPELAATTITEVKDAHDQLPAATGLFADSGVAAARLGDMDVALQRTVATSMLTDRVLSAKRAALLRRTISNILASVKLAQLYQGQGTNAVYTFASKDASLPVTVVNRLDAAVRIVIRVSPQSGYEGSFPVAQVRPRVLQPGQRVQLKVALHLKRVGNIPVTVNVDDVAGKQIVAQTIMIRGTALGTIGIVITVVAGVVLVLAVALRLTRRALRRRRTKAEATA